MREPLTVASQSGLPWLLLRSAVLLFWAWLCLPSELCTCWDPQSRIDWPADLHGNDSGATQPCVLNAVICIRLRNVFEEKERPDVAHGGNMIIHPPGLGWSA